MTKFYREAELNIKIRTRDLQTVLGDLNIKNLRIAFQITKTQSWSTNKATIRVWNLNDEKRAKLNDFGDEITVLAGYREEGGTQLLFSGDTTKVSHSFDFPEIVSNFEAGDGERYLNQVRFPLSYGEKTPARVVLQQIADKMGVPIAFFDDTDNIIYQNGYQNIAFAKDSLDKVTENLGLTWSIQNGKLYFIKKNGTTKKAPVTFDQENGMIGVPERYTYKRLNLFNDAPLQGWRVKTLLRPDVLPGDKVKVKSKKVDVEGIYYVSTVKHTGDTYGNDWSSNWELIRV